MNIMLPSMVMIMMRVFVDISMVLDDWCYIRMMWNVVWQSSLFQIVKPEFFYSTKSKIVTPEFFIPPNGPNSQLFLLNSL